MPAGFDSILIPKGTYQKIISEGKIPDCIVDTWKEIWNSGIPRDYNADFEVYGEGSKDWSNAVVEVFISVKE